MTLLRLILLGIGVVYVLPAIAAALLWHMGEHPRSWRDADWSSAAILPSPPTADGAQIMVLAARTGGLKGAVSEHSWIVIKRPGANRYERFDKVGWGRPIRRDAYAADARWYSNVPRVVARMDGAAAVAAIPAVLAAVESYPFAEQGGYRLFPGPNSNSFVAHVLREVPQIGAVLPPAAVGRDYPTGGRIITVDADGRDLHVSLLGYAGFSLGMRSGVEAHFMGLVAGFDPLRLALKIPAFGTVSLR
ncbi:DUF3750 domain-containing protein [Aureimonas populi]|uniref:DUF3750 domain-containing protein n=1 Tax=Aureimonas populi TaxID=1701758 RepID=A0ABW5CIL0_9HYPH|nr:DUF3750 domain-containing protein [Aureimonas populi]